MVALTIYLTGAAVFGLTSWLTYPPAPLPPPGWVHIADAVLWFIALPLDVYDRVMFATGTPRKQPRNV